jgi:hypothetical protein
LNWLKKLLRGNLPFCIAVWPCILAGQNVSVTRILTDGTGTALRSAYLRFLGSMQMTRETSHAGRTKGPIEMCGAHGRNVSALQTNYIPPGLND